MKKLFGMICLVVMLCSMALPCLATEIDFYVDPKDPQMVQIIKENDSEIRSRLSLLLIEGLTPDDAFLDKESFEYDLEHIAKYKEISTAQIRELLKTDDVATFVDNLTTRFHYIPTYYQRQQNPTPIVFVRLQNKNGQFEFGHIDSWDSRYTLTCMLNKELSMQRIKDVTSEEYTLLFNFYDDSGVCFSLVEKQQTRYLVNLGGAPSSYYFDAMAQKYKDMLKTPVWTVEQAEEYFAEYQRLQETIERPKSKERLYGEADVSAAQSKKTYQWVYWAIGSVVAIGAAVAFFLLICRRKTAD